MLDAATRDRLLARIGLTEPPPATLAGLRTVHRAYVSRVPYEDLTVQLGESEPLHPGHLVERVLHGGRGGYCFEINTVLYELLVSLGFSVERRQGIVAARDAHATGEPTNHLALVVDVPGAGPAIAEAGWGEGPLDPLPLAEGSVTSGAFTYTIERDGPDGWWVGQHEHGSSPGFRFADAPADLADFQPHHERLSTSADSSFVKTLVVQQPHDDRIVTLRARTRFADGPGLRERAVVADEDAFAAALRDGFGIDPVALGPERLARLWRQALEQHVAHQELTRPAPAT
jgi:N-hydroxyarylamine O-acetyltransferase